MKLPERSSYGLKLILLVVGLPLLVFIWGEWQLTRVRGEADVAAEWAQIQQTIDSLRRLQQERGFADVLVKDGAGKTHSAQVVIGRLNKRRWLSANLMSYTPFLYGGTKYFGLLAACIGGLGLLRIRGMGRRALASRDELLRGFNAGRNLLPWLLAGTGLFFILGIACAIGFEVLNYYAGDGAHSRLGTRMAYAGVLFAGGILIMGFTMARSLFNSSSGAFKQYPLRLMGRKVTEAEAPKLWAFVRDVAERAKAVMPDNIVIGLDECFFVTENFVSLVSGGVVPSGRTLCLPLPYMAFMSREETAAVIGHELGHFTGADTEYSLRFTPIYASAVNNLTAVAEAPGDDADLMRHLNRPAVMLGEFFLDSFNLAVQHWSRLRELDADRMGASVAGNEAIASSLLRISALAPHIDAALAECWQKGGAMHGGILERIIATVAANGIGDLRAHLEDAQPHPTDSHPTVRQRMEALMVAPSEEFFARVRGTQYSGLLQELGLMADDAGGMTDEAAISPAGTAAAVAQNAAGGLSKALEREFVQVAQDHAAREIAELEEIAAKGKETIPVYEGGILVVGILCFAAVSLFFAGALLPAGGLPFCILMAAGVVAAFLVARLIKRRRRPFVSLTEHGMLFANLEAPLPWIAVANYSISVMRINGLTSSVSLFVDLAEGYEPPPFSGDRRAKYLPKKRQVRLIVMNLRGRMNADAFSRLFGEYWAGGQARARLRELRKAAGE